MKIKAYSLNAFAKTPPGGNPAGVVLDADSLSRAQMLKIAQKINFSETAFVKKSKNADLKIQYFTPSKEVPLCGHATIATFSLLQQLNQITSGSYSLETESGLLSVKIHKDGAIFMQQQLPIFGPIIPPQKIASSLNITSNQFAKNHPIQIVSTGLRDILIPIDNLKNLLNLKPNFDVIAQISKKYDVVGYHLFTLETLYQSTAHCRNFAPLYQIPEEAATGTSNAALGCYLYKYRLINPKKSLNLIFEQGDSMEKPSVILTRLTIKDHKITRVEVGSTASEAKIITLSI